MLDLGEVNIRKGQGAILILHAALCLDNKGGCIVIWKLATFRLQYEDDYKYEFSVLSNCALGLAGENVRSTCAQILKLVLVLQSEGRY